MKTVQVHSRLGFARNQCFGVRKVGENHGRIMCGK